MKPKRRPPTGNVRRVQHINGNIPSVMTNKAGRTVQCESHNERRAVMRWERDKSVKAYASQPEALKFVDKHGKSHTYIPDFKVWMITGSITLCEISIRERMEKRRIYPSAAMRQV